MPITIRETRNPAAIGWEAVTDTGATVQVAWPRGSTYLLFAIKPQGHDRWSTTSQMARERWSVDGTYADAKRVATEFLTTASEPSEGDT